jgi:predicted  nucleic acid-binding Zn-ribbon protein
MDEVKEILHAILKNQEVTRAEMQGINTRMDGMNTRMDDMNMRIDDMNTRIDGMNTRIDGMNTRMDSLQKEMNHRFDAVEGEIRQVKRKVHGIEVDLDEALNRIGKLEAQKHT